MKEQNGHVSQTALDRHITNNENYSFNTLIEGVVVGIHYPSEDENRGKNEVEYDVDPTSVFGMGRIRNVTRADIAAGLDDGEDNILRCADGAVGTAQWQSDTDPPQKGGIAGKKPTPRYNSNGDRVVVGFINGNAYRPVILGVRRHFYTRMHPVGEPLKDINGKALSQAGALLRRTRHRGTEMVIDEKGSVTVTFGKTPDNAGKDTDDKKTLTLNLGKLTLLIDNANDPTTFEVKIKDGASILKLNKDSFNVGHDGESMVLGEKLESLLNNFLTAYSTHTHTGNLGAPTTPPVVPVSDIQSSVPNIKSTWAKVSGSKP